MKRITIIIVGVLAAATTLMAQNDSGEKSKDRNRRQSGAPEARAKEMTDRLKEELNLTEQQSEQLYAIHLKYAEERKALSDANKDQRESQRDEMKGISEKQRAEMKAILTEEQAGRLDAIQAERMQKREARPERSRKPRGG